MRPWGEVRMPANQVVIKIHPVLHAMHDAGLYDERTLIQMSRYETHLAQGYLSDWMRKEALASVGGGWSRG